MGALILGAITLALTVYGLVLRVPAFSPRSQMVRRLGPRPVIPVYTARQARLAFRLARVPATRHMTPAQFRALQCALAGGAAVFVLMPWLLFGQTPDRLLLFAYPTLLAATPEVWLQLQLQRRRALLLRAYPDMLAHLATQTRAGAGTLQAFASMPAVLSEPLKGEVIELTLDLRVAPFPAALNRFADRCGIAEVRTFAASVVYQQSLGIALPEVLASEEAHALSMAKQLARQRIQASAVVLAAVTVVLLINGLAIYLLPAGFDLARMVMP